MNTRKFCRSGQLAGRRESRLAQTPNGPRHIHAGAVSARGLVFLHVLQYVLHQTGKVRRSAPWLHR